MEKDVLIGLNPALTELAAIAINIPIPNQSVLPTLEEAREEIKK